ncbi:hypothetical protein [Gilliamella apicola]|uniref:hypothetical protein n=1 Tax=Gilliamella apicola TaxID=1196095 RepID=UPI002FEE2020
MNERKYRYKKAKNTKEYIEAIYEDLTYSSKENYYTNKTIKDYLSDILSILNSNKEANELKKLRKEFSIDCSLILLAIISFCMICSARESNEWSWFSNYQYSVKLFGIILSFIYIGISIERTSFFKTVWKFGFTKFIISIAISALVIFCTSKASEFINIVFHVDASVFPYTRAYMTGLLVFQYISPFFIIIIFFSLLHSLNIWQYIQYLRKKIDNYEEPPILSIIFLVLSIIVLCFSYHWLTCDFSENEYPYKVYRLAHNLDFNSKHPCSNIDENTKVIFLDSQYNKVLIDENSVQTRNLESFVNKDQSGIPVPKKFNIVSCKLD